MTKEALARVQTGLRDLGYDPGPIDGLWGARTRAAAQALIDANGRAATPAPRPAPAGGAMIHQGATRHPVREIIIHCAATRPDWMAGRPLAEKVAEIRRWHMSPPNNWRDIGYHWIIDRDGARAQGRAETEIGAHTVGRNSGTIGICLLGGHGSSERDAFAANFTPAQDAALRQLIAEIRGRSAITLITGHNQYAAKACPGFNVPAWLAAA
ncbi:N-acetylmuramoyl-L-alanine amidase [Halodurantibacterium flavum]|uniref:N-acetylmuramoyl-L-alanine amidase n=1 Tax=Halodurantibacterium flavum TaxID=1382802 RepID=A0ABW4SAE9_9RHOB